MRLLYIGTILLLLLKCYSGLSLSKAKSKQLKIDEFVQYDFDNHDWNRNGYHLKKELERLSRSTTECSAATDELLNNLPAEEVGTTDDFLKLFNGSVLKSLIAYPAIEYESIIELSPVHNNRNLLNKAFFNILDVLDSLDQKKQSWQEQFFVTAFKTHGNSMLVDLAYGLNGPVKNMSLEFKDKQYELDSLPINLGPINGVVKIKLTDPVTGSKRWYKKEF